MPWAARPYDLRQAKIPAFPGAAGGGMFTFGGRGGKAVSYTHLMLRAAEAEAFIT